MAENRAEEKTAADKPSVFYAISFVFHLILHKGAFYFWDAEIENPAGLCPSWLGLRPKMGHSQFV